MQTLLDKKTKEVLTLEAEKKSMSDKIAALTAENKMFREQDVSKEKRSSADPGAQKLVDIEALLNERLDKIENNIDSIITKKLNESIKEEVSNIDANVDSASETT